MLSDSIASSQPTWRGHCPVSGIVNLPTLWTPSAPTTMSPLALVSSWKLTDTPWSSCSMRVTCLPHWIRRLVKSQSRSRERSARMKGVSAESYSSDFRSRARNCLDSTPDIWRVVQYLEARTVIPATIVIAQLRTEGQGGQMVCRLSQVRHIGRKRGHELVNDPISVLKETTLESFQDLILIGWVDSYVCRAMAHPWKRAFLSTSRSKISNEMPCFRRLWARASPPMPAPTMRTCILTTID